MNRKDIQRRIIDELENRYSQRECETIARWIAEDWSRLMNVYESDTEEDLYKDIIDRLKSGYPVQYILKQADFYGRPFYVDKRVLIPRPETEELVEWILKDTEGVKECEVLDIGTGSGCIAITLAKERHGWNVLAADFSTDALAVARKNVRRLEGKVRFVRWNILEGPCPTELPALDIIVSNPPYIPKGEWKELDQRVRDFEPGEALRTEGDALQFYRKMSALAPELLRSGGCMYVECHEERTEEVMDLFIEAGLQSVEQRKDLQGKWRMVKGRWLL